MFEAIIKATIGLIKISLLGGTLLMLWACQLAQSKAPQYLNSESFSDILVAEFALSRDNLAQASDLYLHAAGILNSSELAARATYAAQFVDDAKKYVNASQTWVGLGKGNPEASQHLSQALLSQGRQDEAKDVLLTIINNHKSYMPAPILLAGLYIRDQQFEKADKILRPYTSQTSINEQLGKLHLKALSALKLERRSRELLKQLLKQYPLNSEWRFLLATTYKEQGRNNIAEAILLEGVELNPTDSEMHFRTAVFFESIQKKKHALHHYSQVTSGPNLQDSLEAQLQLTHITLTNATALFKRWKTQYQSSLEIIAYLLWHEGNYYLETNQTIKALILFEQGVHLFPSDVRLIISLAMLQAEFQDWHNMEENLHKVLLHDPNNAMALNTLGYYYADQNKNLTLAQQYITKALSLEPNNAAFIDSAGWIAFRLGDLQTAHNHLSAAWKAMPNVETTAHLGAIEWALGNSQKAFSLWNQILIKDPHNKIIRRVMDDVQTRYPV